MKIIVMDNYGMWDYEDVVCENIKVQRVADLLCKALNDSEEDYFFEVVNDDYVLTQDREV